MTSSLTLYLALRIFDSIRHHSISGACKNICFGKGRRFLSKKVTKSKIGSKNFDLTKNWFHSTKISNQISMLFLLFFLHIKFSCSDNITARNSKNKCYKKVHISRCSGGLSTGVASIFMLGGCKSDIMDFLYSPRTVITETVI